MGGEIEVNVRMLEDARRLLYLVLALGKPSGALYPDDRIEAVRKIFLALGLNIILYGKDNLIAISFDLGVMSWVKNGTPEGTRTPDLLVRNQTLYPTELQAHVHLQFGSITFTPARVKLNTT